MILRVSSAITRVRITSAALFVLVAAVFWIRSDVFFNLGRALLGGGAVSLPEAARPVERETYFSRSRDLSVVFYLVDGAARKLKDAALARRNGWLGKDYKRVAAPPDGSNVIFVSGSGTYHHHTLSFISGLKSRPAVLYLIDAHPDSRPSGRSDCGSWVGFFDGDIVFLGGAFGLVFETMRWLDPALVSSGRLEVYAAPRPHPREGYIKTGPSRGGDVPGALGRLVAGLRRDPVSGFFGSPGAWVRWKTTDDFLKISAPRTALGVSRASHLSVDLDVLSARHIETEWGNGYLDTATLTALVRAVSRGAARLKSADICGWAGTGSDEAFRDVFRVIEEEMSYGKKQ